MFAHPPGARIPSSSRLNFLTSTPGTFSARWAIPEAAARVIELQGLGSRAWFIVFPLEFETVALVQGTPPGREPAPSLVQGAPESIEMTSWFGEAAPHIRSLALMPLRVEGECVGLLALGSAEAERFYAGMGTLYLGRIADLAAAALVARAG